MPQEATLPPAAAAFLAQARIAHLATADAAGCPHVIPIVFVVLDGRLYSPLDTKPKRVAPRQLKRVRNLRENPQVAVVVDRYSEDWSRLAYVLLTGTARLVEAGAEAQRALAALRAKYPQYTSGPFALANATLIAIEPARVVCWGPLAE
ncbi:MAG TPA: TIGR03668 family PPOX class F420-dependent oxidoreductase [Chloroflexota bacterium]|nr:TIGR03668 family PPOX class F420-dependent oxidoreductase [Chloroflexota bacterium]